MILSSSVVVEEVEVVVAVVFLSLFNKIHLHRAADGEPCGGMRARPPLVRAPPRQGPVIIIIIIIIIIILFYTSLVFCASGSVNQER